MPQTEAFLVNKGKTWSGWVNRLEKSKIQYNFCLLLVSNTLLFSCKVVSDSWPQGLQHTRLPCPSPSPRACSNSYPQWCHTTISSSVISFSCLRYFPASGSFSQWVSSSHQMAKVLELQLQHQSSQWIFRVDSSTSWEASVISENGNFSNTQKCYPRQHLSWIAVLPGDLIKMRKWQSNLLYI